MVHSEEAYVTNEARLFSSNSGLSQLSSPKNGYIILQCDFWHFNKYKKLKTLCWMAPCCSSEILTLRITILPLHRLLSRHKTGCQFTLVCLHSTLPRLILTFLEWAKRLHLCPSTKCSTLTISLSISELSRLNNVSFLPHTPSSLLVLPSATPKTPASTAQT